MSRSKSPRSSRRPSDDPAAFDRAGAELMTRLARLRATIERKRREGWILTPRAASPEGEPT
jgi:hypothetical protein